MTSSSPAAPMAEASARKTWIKLPQGRVWTGSKAKELGLVDELGGLDKALDIAIAKAGVDAYTVMSYPKKESFFESLMNTNPGNYVKALHAERHNGRDIPAVQRPGEF